VQRSEVGVTSKLVVLSNRGWAGGGLVANPRDREVTTAEDRTWTQQPKRRHFDSTNEKRIVHESIHELGTAGENRTENSGTLTKNSL